MGIVTLWLMATLDTVGKSHFRTFIMPRFREKTCSNDALSRGFTNSVTRDIPMKIARYAWNIKKSPIFMDSGARAAHELLVAKSKTMLTLSLNLLKPSMKIDFATSIKMGKRNRNLKIYSKTFEIMILFTS